MVRHPHTLTSPSSANTFQITALAGGGSITLTQATFKQLKYVPGTTTISLCNQSNDNYRFGFNGKEKDNQWAGIGNSLDYGFRMEDTRIGRFRSTDPLTKKYPWLTPYQFSGNKPTWKVDLDGLEEANSQANKQTSVVVDAGHGGDDPGNVATQDGKELHEADITLKVANYAQKKVTELSGAKAKVTMTRTTDVNPGGKGQHASLAARVQISQNANADMFVSIHVNSAKSADGTVNTKADYVDILVQPNANDVSLNLAKNIQTQLQGVTISTNTKDVSVRSQNLSVLRNQPNIASSLIEIGFLTNPQQAKLFQDENYLQKIGNAIGQGIYNSMPQSANNLPNYLAPPPPQGTSSLPNMFSLYNLIKR